MQMTPAEAFRYGFLLRCADEGLDVAHAEKRAALMTKSAFGVGDALGYGALAAAVPLAGAGMLGYVGGRTLGRADNDYAAKETLEAAEKVNAYTQLAEKLRRQRAALGAR